MKAPTRLLATARSRLSFPYRAATTPRSAPPSEDPPRSGAGYETDWARRYPARLARMAVVQGIMRPAMKVVATPELEGLDRLEGLVGPAIFAANHHSHLDTPLLLSHLPEPWRHEVFVGAAADYFFDNRLKSVASALFIGAIPIERTKVTRRSADEAAKLLRKGWSMLIFPEGGRSPDGWGQPFRAGAAYLAIKCDVPVVPIHVDGTGRILRKGRNVPKPAVTRLTFGAPMYPTDADDSRRFAARLEAEVTALADESTTDWWSARQRAHQGTNPPLGGPDESSWRRAWALGDRDRSRRRQRRAWPTSN